MEGKGDHWEGKPGEGACSTNRYWAPTVSQALDQVVQAHHQSRPGAWAGRDRQPGRHCGYPSRGNVFSQGPGWLLHWPWSAAHYPPPHPFTLFPTTSHAGWPRAHRELFIRTSTRNQPGVSSKAKGRRRRFPDAPQRRGHRPRREAAAAFLWELLLTSLPPALTTWPVGESKCTAPPQRRPLPACSKRHSSKAGVGDLGPAAELDEAQADRLAWSSAGRGEMIALGTNQ